MDGRACKQFLQCHGIAVAVPTAATTPAGVVRKRTVAVVSQPAKLAWITHHLQPLP